MDNLAAMVEYDRLYPIKIVNPKGEDTGIVINVVSKDSKRVVDALRKAQGDYWSIVATGGTADMPDVEFITLVNCIDSWDWGSKSWDYIQGAGVASLTDREYLISHPNAKWVKDSIAAGTANLENFMQALPTIVPSGSKKT